MCLCWESTRGIGKHDINTPRSGRSDCIEHHRCRVAATLRNDVDTVTLAPDFKLLPRRCAEGVACCEQDREPLGLQPFRELADRSRLAGAVDAGQHDDKGPLWSDDQRAFERTQKVGERCLEQRLRVRVGSRAFPTRAQIGEQALGCRHADVPCEQG